MAVTRGDYGGSKAATKPKVVKTPVVNKSTGFVTGTASTVKTPVVNPYTGFVTGTADAPSTNSASRNSTGSTGSNVGGVGSAGEVGPAPASSAGTSGAATSMDDALEATLNAIGAQYGMTREQLMADQGEAGRQFRMALAGLRRQRAQAKSDVYDSMVQRGILQSGETLENQTQVARDAAEAQAQLVGDRDFKRAQIAAQLASLAPQEAADRAAATSQHERAKLDLATLEAMYGGGLA